jgi:chemotaxis signal transduction protein
MAIVSPLRARRNARRPVESTQQMIIFCLRQQWFALPMSDVKRVSTFQSSADRPAEHLGATASVDDAGLIKISADRKIFSKARPGFTSPSLELQAPELEAPEPKAPEPDHFSVVFQTSDGEAYALTVNSAPKMHRISPDSIVPFSLDMSIEPMECISGIVRQADHPQTLYLLDPEQLCRNELS